MRTLLILSLSVLLTAACKKEEDSSTPDGSGTGTGSSSGDGGSSSGDGGANEDACVEAGGVCGCAGGCDEGYEPAPPPLLYGCPQPPPGSGACSMHCCLPIDQDTGDSETGPTTTGTGTTSGSGSASCQPQDCYNDGGPCEPNPLELWKWNGSECEVILVGCGTNTGQDCDDLYNDQNVCTSEHEHCGSDGRLPYSYPSTSTSTYPSTHTGRSAKMRGRGRPRLRGESLRRSRHGVRGVRVPVSPGRRHRGRRRYGRWGPGTPV